MNPLILILFLLTWIMQLDVSKTDSINSNSYQLISSKDSITLFVFTGSDWCSNCKIFEKKVLMDSSFNSTLQANQIDLKKIDFPQRKKLNPIEVQYNDSIATVLKFEGSFPGIYIYNHSNNKTYHIQYLNEDASDFNVELLKMLATVK